MSKDVGHYFAIFLLASAGASLGDLVSGYMLFSAVDPTQSLFVGTAVGVVITIIVYFLNLSQADK